MSTRRIVIDVPEKVLLAEKTDETAFGREIRVLAAVMSTAKQITHLRPSTAKLFTHPAAKLFTQAEGFLAK